MNEEDMECKVIASLMIMLDDKFSNEAKIKAMEDVKIIFEKQQKEIEKRLKEIDSLYKMMSAKDDEIEYLEQKLEQYGLDYQILKDKIKEKIEEITSYAYTSAEERDCQDYAIQVLKDLLGD